MDRTFYPLGDWAVLVEFGQGIGEHIHRQVRSAVLGITRRPFRGFIECVPSFASVTVYYNPAELAVPEEAESGFAYVCGLLQGLLDSAGQMMEEEGRVVEIPVCYGGGYGPDLAFVAGWNGMTEQEVIAVHSGGRYLVYAIGFAPGFPYMGGMAETIAAPRKETPGLAIPAGSVGIAGTQTGIYPIGTPGGWQIIGRTPLELFRPEGMPPSLLRSGDTVLFRPIDPEEYRRLRGTGT